MHHPLTASGSAILALATCFLALPAAARAETASWLEQHARDQLCSIAVGGKPRTYLLHVPPPSVVTGPLPLIIVCHGGRGTGAQMAASTRLSELADRDGFIVAYPDGGASMGTPAKPSYSWYAHLNVEEDDVDFMRALIDDLEARYQIDHSLVMVAGGSAGALMAYRAGIELSDRVRAIGSIAGSMVWNIAKGEPPPLVEPAAAVSLIEVHGQQDHAVPYEGFENERARCWPVERSVRYWIDHDGCGAETVAHAPGVDTHTWSGGRDGTSVRLCVLPEAGHGWPGAGAPLDSDQALWDFLVRDRPCRIGPATRSFVGSLAVSLERAAPAAADEPTSWRLRCTRDGSHPSVDSPACDAPFVITATTTVRAVAFVDGARVGPEVAAIFTRLVPRPADRPAHALPGLRYAYAEGEWELVPDLANMPAASTGICALPDIGLAKREDGFAFSFSGFLSVPEDDVYELACTSDDGSVVDIGGERVIENDGLHPARTRSARFALAAGAHALHIGFFEADGGQQLSLTLRKGTGEARAVTAEDFLHEE